MRGYRKSNDYSIGLFKVMQIVFIILKLCNLIDWSWWVVFAPTFANILIVLLIYAYVKIRY